MLSSLALKSAKLTSLSEIRVHTSDKAQNWLLTNQFKWAIIPWKIEYPMRTVECKKLACYVGRFTRVRPFSPGIAELVKEHLGLEDLT